MFHHDPHHRPHVLKLPQRGLVVHGNQSEVSFLNCTEKNCPIGSYEQLNEEVFPSYKVMSYQLMIGGDWTSGNSINPIASPSFPYTAVFLANGKGLHQRLLHLNETMLQIPA